jgi:uncharacterized membrane protein
MENPEIIPEVSWTSVATTAAYSYGIMSVLMAATMLITTLTTCRKTHFASSIQLGLIIALAPALLYSISMKYTFIRKPFANVFEMMGISPQQSSIFAGTYIILLILLPLVVYGIHSAEESACVASADEMAAFKTKMMKELQEKHEAEEKNAKKK